MQPKRQVLFALVIAFQALNVAQASLQADYGKLVNEHALLAVEDQALKEKRAALDASGQELQLKWGSCAGGRWSVVWSPFESELSRVLTALGRDRNKLATFQKKLLIEEQRLDTERKEIEQTFSDRERGRQYDSAFRKHMFEFEIKFLHPYREVYLVALKKYLTAYQIWESSTTDALLACENSDIRAPILTAALQRLDSVFQILDLLKSYMRKYINPS